MTEKKRPDIISAPVLNFTQADANKVALMCPYEYQEGKENVLFVMFSLTKESLAEARGVAMVVHHVKDPETGAEKIAGEWQLMVGIRQTIHKHIFEANIPS